jgi:glycosyltransferase involved in cell wall biosynthesis
MVKRILFPRSGDASNFNAQAKNIQNILRRWQNREVRPAVFSFCETDPILAANPNVDVIRITPNRLWRANVALQYFHGWDAVFCPGIHHFADWAALRVSSATGRPLAVISTIEGLLAVESDDSCDLRYSEIAGHPVYAQRIPKGHWRRAEQINREAKFIIAISPFLKRQAETLYDGFVAMLPLGVDAEFVGRPRARRTRSRVVCAANVNPHKQPHQFLRLARRFPQADFVWFGDGELRRTLLEEIARKGPSNVSFPGLRQPRELAGEFANSDIMVLPSFAEGVPKVTQEAASAGLAQVIYGFYEAPTVIDGANGFVVWDEAQMAERLGIVLADPGLAARMGQEGVRMSQAWSWDILAPRWEAAIVDFVRALPSPGRTRQENK